MAPWELLSRTSRRGAPAPLPVTVLEAPDGEDAGERPEDIDLIALQSTPAEFLEAECDVARFELHALGARFTAADITAVKDLRQRQLDARPLVCLPTSCFSPARAPNCPPSTPSRRLSRALMLLLLRSAASSVRERCVSRQRRLARREQARTG